jgi:hypothetical protein
MATGNVLSIKGGGYPQGGAAAGRNAPITDPEGEDKDGFWPLEKCINAYTTYLDNKTLEIQEQQNARRYRHGAQWTSDQIKTFNERKQPVVTYNKIGRKVDGIVGLVERLKQDPKAYPRTPQHQEGADLATAVLRYLMDRNKWNEVAPLVNEAAAVDGLAGIELDLQPMPAPKQTGQGMMPGMPPPEQQQPDYDVIFGPVDNDGFFYDPRSFKHDFSDARYVGMGKYVDEELMSEILPGMDDDIKAACDSSLELTSNSDRDTRWFQANGDFKQVRLVDIWYKSKGGWKWALFTGSKILMQGNSPFTDENGKQFAKYLMFSASVDHDGDRYGFVRNLQSPQDEVNQRRSKGLHELNNRRIIATKAAVADTNVEKLRLEAARADGIVLVNTGLDDLRFDDQAKQAQIMGQLEFMRDAAQEIENFGPNAAIAGGDVGKGSSGRAIALLQQAGIAELGPYMTNLRSWKIRVYRSLFNAAQSYWVNERWIRVTDAQGNPQFVQINAMVLGPDGMPQKQNAIGELDVDIILDEGPDTVTLMQDTYDAISQALPAVAPMLSPTKSAAVMDVLIETSPLPADVKKRFRDAGEQEQTQPDPKQAEAQAKLAMEQQTSQAKLALEKEKATADMALKQQAAELEQQTEQQKAAAEIAAAREKAAAEMEIAREKARNEMQIEIFKTGQAEQAIQQQNQMPSQIAEVLATLAQHQAMLQELNKPRKAVFHRDPRTGKVIGAAMVSED